MARPRRSPVALVAFVALAAALVALWLRGRRPPARGAADERTPRADVPEPPPATDAARDAGPAAHERDAASERDAARDVAASALDAAAPASREVLLRAPWGPAPGEFGRRRDPESNPEAPMALVARGPRDWAVLDQVNHRVQRFDRGQLVGTVALPSGAVQDLALGPHGELATLDRLRDRSVMLYGPDGAPQAMVPLASAGLRDGASATGVFFDARGVFIEREHRGLVRVAGTDGQADPDRAGLQGRPSRAGDFLVNAAISDRAAGVVTVTALEPHSGSPLWERALRLPDGVLHVLALDTDAPGRTYLVAAVGHEAAGPPIVLQGLRVVAARLERDGTPSGLLDLAVPPTSDETFRPVAVDDDGALYELVPTEDGLEVLRYTFP